jgi:hypothetical protein
MLPENVTYEEARAIESARAELAEWVRRHRDTLEMSFVASTVALLYGELDPEWVGFNRQDKTPFEWEDERAALRRLFGLYDRA